MPQTLHIAIIGGGAAGFFAAIEAKRNFPHADITIFEKNSKVLAKVEITGDIQILRIHRQCDRINIFIWSMSFF